MNLVAKKGGSAKGNKKSLLQNQILSIFYHESSKSIPDLSKALSISIPTVTRLLEDLVKSGYVLEVGEGDSSGGRKPVMYGLNPDSTYVVAIDIGRFYVRIGLVNLRNEFVTPIRTISEGLVTQNDLLQIIKKETLDILDSMQVPFNKVLGAGIALPGLIDSKTGISYTYFSSVGKPLYKLFSELFPFPVYVEHDTKAMALAESVFGLAKGKQDVLCLILGTGIGLSMILGGKLYKGNSGFAGEFGHIPVIENGQLCFCGKIGCLETVASGATLVQNARTGIGAGAATYVANLVDNNLDKITLDIILKAAAMGDQYAIALLSRTGEYLGKGIAMLIHLFNPEMIIIGGELSKAGNYLLDPIRQTLNPHTIARILKDTTLVTSDLGENATLMGSVALVIKNFFESDSNF